MAQNVATLTFAGDTDKLARSFKQVNTMAKDTEDRVEKSSRRMGGALKGLGATAALGLAGAGAALIGFGANAVKSAVDLAETQSKVAVLFGESAKAVEAFADTAASKLGQSRQSALDAAATFATFGRGAGLTGDKLVGFSTKMTALASDLASFNNTSPEEAIVAIGAALRGESEPIRRFGVLLDDATLRNEALKLGLIKTTKEALTPQQKVLAAQAAIMKQTTAAQGDFERTSGGLANKQRIMKAEMANVSAELGTKLLPVMLKLGDVALKTIGWISENAKILGPLAAVIGVVVAAQWAWNIAMTANPIGLIIVGIAALVAAIVWIATKTTWFQTAWNKSWGAVKGAAVAVWDWLSGLPAKVGAAFGKLAGIVTAPWRAAFNAIARLWNNTIGRLSFSVPDWVPGIGGKGFSMPNVPTFHRGGVMPGAPGTEGLALLQAGERVTPAGSGGGVTIAVQGGAGTSAEQMMVALVLHLIRIGALRLVVRDGRVAVA